MISEQRSAFKFRCLMTSEHKSPKGKTLMTSERCPTVVERCDLPLCISRLVIAPKFAPGQVKDDPDHGFRVCVNALINKCLKRYASTIRCA
jgi:hypothetical protein